MRISDISKLNLGRSFAGRHHILLTPVVVSSAVVAAPMMLEGSMSEIHLLGLALIMALAWFANHQTGAS